MSGLRDRRLVKGVREPLSKKETRLEFAERWMFVEVS